MIVGNDHHKIVVSVIFRDQIKQYMWKGLDFYLNKMVHNFC